MQELKFKKPDKVKAVAWLDSLIDSFDDREYIITVKQARDKRSLSANSYFWVLCDKLSEKLKMPKEEIYRNYIRNVGGNTEYLRLQNDAVPLMKRVWESKGIGWQVETLDSGYDGWTDCILYYGSSTFDSGTMSRLINLVTMDCDSYGIETLESAECERLCAEWEKYRKVIE